MGMPAALLQHGADRARTLLMPRKQQGLVGQRENAPGHAVPQGRRVGRAGLVRAGVHGKQATAEEPVTPENAQAVPRVAWRGQHTQMLVAKGKKLPIGR